MEQETKICTKCNLPKPLTDFFPRYDRWAQGTNKLSSWCKKCHIETASEARRRNPEARKGYARTRYRSELKKKYGITFDEYERIREQQGGGCAICGVDASHCANGGKRYLSVDHDHKTSKIRGLLCNNCNRAIGLLGDSVHLLQKAICYIEGGEQNGA